ncbi:MAG: hypothetical protein ISS74_01875 [Planctomycetes bacterium]|nr:hypothetical protein [Planctomycetota bacterium]
MTRCPDMTEWVLYAAGEASPDQRTTLSAHLEACQACRAELEAVRRGVEALGALDPAPPVRAEALASLRDRLAAQRRRPRARTGLRRKAYRYGWAAVAAAAAAIVLAVFLSTPDADNHAWADSADVENEIVEIAAELELLEADTFAGAWELDLLKEAPPVKTPPGQSRADTPELEIQNG